jgi:DNA-binding HxlR family transcriptional regulator
MVAHRWALLVLKILQDGPARFSELRRILESISPQALTRTLRELERDGMVARRIFAEVPPRVEYSLTELGQTLCPVIEALRAWAERFMPEVLAARGRHDGGARRRADE